MSGATDTLFKPDAAMTRGMVARVLHGMEGSKKVTYKPLFSDIKKGKYYSEPITWCKLNNVINGNADGTFKPDKKVSSYAKESMQWAVSHGLLNGKDNGTILDPKGNASRAECSKMLVQTYKLIYKK